ncbi:hypothetical protein V6N13_108997 [Hibiscus sabdariffa]
MLKVGNMGYPRFGTTLELLPDESHDNPMLTTTIEKFPPNESLGCPYSAAILKLSPIEELGSPGLTTEYYGICGAGESVGDSERVVTTPMAWNNWFHNIMNPNEFKGGDSSTNVGSYMDLTHYNPYVEPGSSSVAHCTVLEGSSIGGSSSVVA